MTGPRRHRIAGMASLAAVTAAVTLSAAAPSSAAVTQLGQIVLITPSRVWDETAWLAYPPPGDLATRLQVGRRRVPVYWAMAAVGAPDTTTALGRARRDVSSAAVVERPLSAAERRRFRVIPLYVDADVLVAAAGSPVCTTGVPLGRARAILRGQVTRWAQASPAASGMPEPIRAWVPRAAGGTKLPMLDVAPPRQRLEPARPVPRFGRYGASVTALPESALPARAAQPGAVAAMRYSSAAPSIAGGALCALPIAGVTPSEDTLRSGAYPVTRPVGLAFSRRAAPAITRAIRVEYVRWATGPKGIGRYGGAIRG